MHRQCTGLPLKQLTIEWRKTVDRIDKDNNIHTYMEVDSTIGTIMLCLLQYSLVNIYYSAQEALCFHQGFVKLRCQYLTEFMSTSSLAHYCSPSQHISPFLEVIINVRTQICFMMAVKYLLNHI